MLRLTAHPRAKVLSKHSHHSVMSMNSPLSQPSIPRMLSDSCHPKTAPTLRALSTMSPLLSAAIPSIWEDTAGMM